MDAGRQSHWENVYKTKDEHEVSWFEELPTVSLDLIHASGVNRTAAIVDIGGGASRLVDALLGEGFENISVLDISATALEKAKARLGVRGDKVHWLVADVTTWEPVQAYDLWHDRATFHFLTTAADRAAYADRVLQGLRRGGQLIIGTFAPDGPERCSGLPVVRQDAKSIGELLGPAFELIEDRRYDHHTPMGAVQHFQFGRFLRRS